MAVQIQLRRGTAAQWTSANPTLAAGEVGFETDTNKEKIGDGTTAWNSLAYFGGSATPAGANTQVQYNSSGSFAGSANLTFDGSTLTTTGVNKTIAAATQDAVQLQGRAGGTGSYVATITPTTLTASRTFTLPDAAGTLLLSGGDLGTPSAGVVTNLTGTASININGTVGATTANAGTFSSTVHKGATSGTITLTAPTVAGTQSYTLPTAVPAANGYALTSTTAGVMSWEASGGGGSPGGSPTQVQYNNSGAFGGISGFTTDGTRVTASTTIGVGGATPSTSGSGVSFPATQSASTDVNTLDDYEEGTWTPNLGGSTTYTNQSGRYTKIGRFVFVSAKLIINSIGSGAPNYVYGLPFTPSILDADAAAPVGYYSGLAASAVSIVGYAANGSTLIQWYGLTIASTTVGTSQIFTNGTIFQFSCCYTTAT